MKNVLRSKTVWGILAAAAAAAGVPGKLAAPESASTVDAVVQIVGLVLALYGRWKAGGLAILPTKDVPPAP